MLVAYWLWSVGVVVFFLPFIFIWTLDVLSGGGILEQLGTVSLVIVFGLGMLYGLWFLVDLIRGKLTRGLVALSSEGIYHRSWSFRGFLPWEVRPARRDQGTMAVGRSALLYHALCYYHEHPDARAELSAERSVQRLRAGDLEV